MPTKLVAATLVAAAVAASAAATAAPSASAGSFGTPFLSSGTDQLRAGAATRIARIRWRRAASAGATVLVSPAYDGDPSTGHRWAAFFQSLIHGPELDRLTAYIATPAEIQHICVDGIGCYSSNSLWISDQAVDGVSPQEVAAHEYGHHVAFNRFNAPWAAIDWGTKRWASVLNICSRVGAFTAFPGDEGSSYTLNPGEAFAETYRVLNGYAPDDWSVVDPSFMPTPAALDALRADVVTPWNGPTLDMLRARFNRGTVWSRRLSTPLDGTVNIRLPVASDDVELLSGDGKRVLARGSWTSSGGKSLSYVVCGARALTLRVTRSGGPRTVAVMVSRP